MIEVLASTVRNTGFIQGISIDTTEKKISLSADDMLFIICSNQISFDILMEVLEGFTSVSNLRINKSKSFIVRLGRDKRGSYRLQGTEEFHWVGTDTFTYVGVPLHNNVRESVVQEYY